MLWTNAILLTICLLIAGRELADWLRRRRSLTPGARYTSLEAAVDAMTQVADGLAEDIDGLRKEIRSAVGLPKETQIPRVLSDLRMTRTLAWLSLLLDVIILAIWILREASR
jgi:hypothetical protein